MVQNMKVGDDEMSLYLGKIHYWLFNKIVWLENLEKEVIKLGKSKGLTVEELKEKIYNKYGEPTEDKPLEEMIDTSNIHGWLQNKIEMAEKRQAAFITYMLNCNKELKDDLMELYKAEGEKEGDNYRKKVSPSTPEEIYNILNDFILDGMPCDRVNQVIDNNENEFSWHAVICLHKIYWDEVEGDVRVFYALRDEWIKGFMEKISNDFIFKRFEGGYQTIVRKDV